MGTVIGCDKQGSHSTWKNDESFSSHGILKFCKISWKNDKKPGKMRISVHSSQQVFSFQNMIFSDIYMYIWGLYLHFIQHTIYTNVWFSGSLRLLKIASDYLSLVVVSPAWLPRNLEFTHIFDNLGYLKSVWDTWNPGLVAQLGYWKFFLNHTLYTLFQFLSFCPFIFFLILSLFFFCFFLYPFWIPFFCTADKPIPDICLVNSWVLPLVVYETSKWRLTPPSKGETSDQWWRPLGGGETSDQTPGGIFCTTCDHNTWLNEE